MIFEATAVEGAWIVEPERFEDERGFFARTFCRREFAERGLTGEFVQANVAFNHRRATLRGMHWQAEPHTEVKLVRCTRGAVHDVVVDLRAGSPSYLAHAAVRLDAGSGRQLYIPRGVAHGYLTLEDDSELAYLMSEFYQPDAGRGARWNDPAFGIDWPLEPRVIAPRDAGYPDWEG